MMRRFLFLILSFTLLAACNEKLIEKPKNLIPEKKMEKILYDLAILGAAKSSNAAVLKENNIETMDYIYTKYDIDSVQFVESDGYYASLPAVYEAIYTNVADNLESEKKRLEKMREDVNKKAAEKVLDKKKKVTKDSSAIQVKDSLP